MKLVEMTALRRFRHKDGQALVWLNKGDPYLIPEDRVASHTKSKRGELVKGAKNGTK